MNCRAVGSAAASGLDLRKSRNGWGGEFQVPAVVATITNIRLAKNWAEPRRAFVRCGLAHASLYYSMMPVWC